VAVCGIAAAVAPGALKFILAPGVPPKAGHDFSRNAPMRWSFFTVAALALGACKNDARSPLRRGDLAGNWTMTATNAANDSVLVTYEMTATADTTGWSILYPNHGTPIALRVRIDADSVIMDAGPYASTARKGATVTIHGVVHLRGMKLVGTESAYYKVDTTESVVHIKLEGTNGH